MRREGEGQPFYRGGYPGRLQGGDRPPAAPVGRAQRRSPVGGATGPFFFSRDFVANLKKKKLHFGRPGYIFKIFQNGHIFLKF